MITTRYPAASIRERREGVDIIRLGGPTVAHVAPLFLSNIANETDVVIDDLAHVVPWATPWFSPLPGTAFFRHLHSRTLPGYVRQPMRFFLESLERQYPRIYRTWGFVTESESALRDLQELGVPPDHVNRIPPGVDSTIFHPGTKSDIPRIIYFGGMKEYKRPDHALLTFSRLLASFPEAEMFMVGVGSPLPRLVSTARVLGIEGRVRFVGRLPKADLARLLATCSVNLHCSVAEGWGYSIMEASAAGVPTVAYSVPGVTESVVDGLTGYLATDGNVDLLVDAARHALLDRDQLSRQARLFALRHTWDRAADSWIDHLNRCILAGQHVTSGTQTHTGQ